MTATHRNHGRKEHSIAGITFVPAGQPADKYYKPSDHRILFLLRAHGISRVATGNGYPGSQWRGCMEMGDSQYKTPVID